MADPEPAIRHAVMLALSARFHATLAEPVRLRSLGMALHDESLAVRMAAVPIIGALNSYTSRLYLRT